MEEMKNDRMERLRLFLRNNGFYIALVVCLVVIGGAILLLALDKEPEAEAERKDDADRIVIVGQSEDEHLPGVFHAPTAVPDPTAKPASAPSKAAPPVQGEILFGFAVDKLLYSVTLDQWTTHPAVDIKADAGTQVKCVFAGTVERVYQDDALGYTVVVQHANDRTTVYANLGENIRVKVGDRLNAGDVVGTVGTSAISECALPAHLHFAVLVDGKAKDPAKYVRLG